jgi:hypothetical protein
LRQAIAFVLAFALLACKSTSDATGSLSPDDVYASAGSLDDQQVTVRGFIRISHDFIGVTTSEDIESECVGMFIRESEFDAAMRHDQHWGSVSGRLDADGCDPVHAFCHDICGPVVIVEPSITTNPGQ